MYVQSQFPLQTKKVESRIEDLKITKLKFEADRAYALCTAQLLNKHVAGNSLEYIHWQKNKPSTLKPNLFGRMIGNSTYLLYTRAIAFGS